MTSSTTTPPSPPDVPTQASARPGCGFQRSTLRVGTFDVGILRAGAGPAVVICPGSAGSDPSWAKDLLTRDFDVIELNPPGWGGTPPVPSPMDQRELAALLAEAVATLGVQRYFLHGASMGGVTALWLAVQHPERVAALTIEGGMTFVGPQHLRHPEQIAVLQKMVERDDPEGDGYPVSPPHPRKPWATPQFYREQVRKRVPMMHRLTHLHGEELAARVRRATVPIRAFLGDQDELLLPTHLQVWRDFPQASTTLVPGAAHDIQNTEPEALVAGMREHFRSVAR